MVYSRTRCPRDQLTSSRTVMNGSEMASVDLSLSTSRPLGECTTWTWTPER